MKKIFKWQQISRPATVGLLTGALAVASLLSSASSTHAVSAANQTAAHQTEAHCSLSTLKGRYIFSESGYTITGNKHLPFADAGQETFDGNGHVTGIFSESDNGQITRLGHYTGTYVVNPDCTGTEITKDDTGVISHYNQFIASDGRTLTYVEIDPGTVSASTLEVRAGD